MLSDADHLDWSPLLALQRAVHATLHTLAGRLSDLELSASEINALANLASGSGRTISELSAATGTRPSTLTGVVDRLEHRGHLTRGAQAGDRRAVRLDLTPSGRDAATTIRTVMAELEQQTVADLPATALDGLRAGLEAFAAVQT